jgi:hypothetical protein
MKKPANRLSRLYAATSGYEKPFFFLMVFINLTPLLITTFYPTVDGPAHLYNARLIVDLLTNNESPLSEYYIFNSQLNPNWTGHFILGLLLLIFPAFLAEKILLLSLLLFLPIVFRRLFSVLEIEEKYLLYFIFPFTHSFLFYWGFYNFHIALVLFFITIITWIKYLKNGFNLSGTVGLTMLALLVLFSHLFVWVILLLTLAALNLKNLQNLLKSDSSQNGPVIKSLLTQLLILLPGLISGAIYLINNPVISGDPDYLKPAGLWQMIMQIQPAKAIEYGREDIFIKWIFYLFILISGYLVINRLKFVKKPVSYRSLTWGLLATGMLAALFIFPDGTPDLGFVSSRLVLFFFLFFIIFLATQKVPAWISIPAFVIINYVNIALIKVYVVAAEKNRATTEQIIAASEFIEPYSTVLPINESGYWLLGHISNYLGVDKPLVILDNYEATTSYFPLQWNVAEMPQLYTGSPGQTLPQFPQASGSEKKRVDYIFVLSDPAKPEKRIHDLKTEADIDNFYELIFHNKDHSLRLFRVRP